MLKLDQITKKFHIGTPDETTLFNQFCFEVQKGEFVSIVGSNGSGKTTLLNIVCGSLPVEGGKVFFGGKDITRLSEYKRADQIGRVFQDPKKGTCDELTILENMALADNKHKAYGLSRGVNKRRTDYYRTLLETCGMGLEDRLNVKAGTLSGGQRQALALILANMTDIELLILDEHTAALDPKSSETVMRITDKLVKEKQDRARKKDDDDHGHAQPAFCAGIWQPPCNDARGPLRTRRARRREAEARNRRPAQGVQ